MQYFSEQCTEIEELEALRSTCTRDLRELLELKVSGMLGGYTMNVILQIEGKLKDWKTYIANLFNDMRTEDAPITCDKMEHSIRLAKTGKGTGPDELPNEIYKLIDDRSRVVKICLHHIIKESNCKKMPRLQDHQPDEPSINL